MLVDRLQIDLVLRNLITNAFESVASQRSGERRVRVSAREAEGHTIQFCVVDSGPGLSASACAHLFEPFVTTKATGMGLGLALSRTFAEAHGGSLDAMPGAHGEFRLRLPLETDDATPA